MLQRQLFSSVRTRYSKSIFSKGFNLFSLQKKSNLSSKWGLRNFSEFKEIINEEMEKDDVLEEPEMVQAFTAKEIKKKFKPIFEERYEEFYPVNFLNSIKFKRNKCACGKCYWSLNERENCGDSSCVGKYLFIGKGVGIGKEKKLTYAEAWKTFEDALTTARIPCTKVNRYPTVARWRNDVDYVAAGIYCFQPHCVIGELAPPANPLIQPQFCVRFNDLDNIGLTGRHYSGFVMMGIQVFNYPNDYKFFKEETIEFNYRWLTEFLKIPPSEITFTEDIWAGGGNMGPSIEYFVGGLEVGNMVFMQYKTFHDGTYEELPIQVIDTGIGLERVAWLVNGESTSYMSTFKNAMEYLTKKTNVEVDGEIWKRLGPLSCQLDVDECENLQATWEAIGKEIGLSKEQISKAIEPVKDLIVILDHTRTAMFLIQDGSLPSNVGGGSNLRNIIRRSFAQMKKHDWWKSIGFEGYMGIFEAHKLDLEPLYGKFKEYSSFEDIMRNEYERWLVTDDVQKKKLKKFEKKKNKLTLEDWETAVTAWGVSPDVISQFLGIPIPDNLYYYIAEKQERIVKAAEQILYNTLHLPETKCLYYDHLSHLWDENNNQFVFKAKVLESFCNVRDNNKKNIVVLDQSSFYPTSGGQEHDTGILTIGGVTYNVVNVEKVGKVTMHILDKELPDTVAEGTEVSGEVDKRRRLQLRNHHTSAHIIFTVVRNILGPHIWQSGAKKTTKQAHLDVTHFKTLTKKEEMQIQEEANRIVMGAHKIEKTLESKAETEKVHGFDLYQGGVVPGNDLRVVKIGDDVDIEACCGTHCDSTSEVGWIKILNSKTIANGVVRIYFVAGERSIQALNDETQIINDLMEMWSISPTQITETAERFFKDFKKFKNSFSDAQKKILDLQVRLALSEKKPIYYLSNEPNATFFFSFLPEHAKEMTENNQQIGFLGKTFAVLYSPKKGTLDLEKLKLALKETGAKITVKDKVGLKKKQVKGVEFVTVISKNDLPDLSETLKEMGFEKSNC